MAAASRCGQGTSGAWSCRRVCTRLADIGLELPAASRELAPLSRLGAYHAGVVAALRGDEAAAARQFRRYLAERPNGDYAVRARDRLNGVRGWPDASGALRSAAPTAAEEAAVAEWIAGWAGAASDPSAADAAALRRASIFAGLGLAGRPTPSSIG